MDGTSTAGPPKKRRRDDGSTAIQEDGGRRSFDMLSMVASAVTESEAERNHAASGQSHPLNGTDGGPSFQSPALGDSAWNGFLGPAVSQAGPLQPRPMKPPPRFDILPDSTAAVSAPAATAGNRWGVSAWLDAQKAAGSASPSPSSGPAASGLPPLPPPASKAAAQGSALSRRDMRLLVAKICTLRTPNLLLPDKVQAAVEAARHLPLRLSVRDFRSGVTVRGRSGAPPQEIDASLADTLLQFSAAIDALDSATDGFSDAIRAMGDKPGARSAEGAAGEAPAVAALDAAMRQTEKAAQVLHQVELAVIRAAEAAVTQFEAVRKHTRAAHRCWSASASLDALLCDRRKLLKQMLRLPGEEVGEVLLALLDGVRVNVAAALDAAAQKDSLEAEVRAQQSALLRRGLPGVGAAALVAGHMAGLVERDVQRYYTLIRIIQNLKARLAAWAADVRALMRTSWWQIPLLDGGARARAMDGGALGTAAGLESSVQLIVGAFGGVVEDWRLPETRSARFAAQHVSEALQSLAPALRRTVSEASATVLRGNRWGKLNLGVPSLANALSADLNGGKEAEPSPGPGMLRPSSGSSTGVQRVDLDAAGLTWADRAAVTGGFPAAPGAAGAAKLSQAAAALSAAAEVPGQAGGMRLSPDLILQMLSTLQQQQQAQQAQRENGGEDAGSGGGRYTGGGGGLIGGSGLGGFGAGLGGNFPQGWPAMAAAQQ